MKTRTKTTPQNTTTTSSSTTRPARSLRVRTQVKAGPTQISYPGVYIQELRAR